MLSSLDTASVPSSASSIYTLDAPAASRRSNSSRNFFCCSWLYCIPASIWSYCVGPSSFSLRILKFGLTIIPRHSGLICIRQTHFQCESFFYEASHCTGPCSTASVEPTVCIPILLAYQTSMSLNAMIFTPLKAITEILHSDFG